MRMLDPIESALLSHFLKIPYKPGGRTLAGADCLGGPILWYRLRLGIEILDPQAGYPSEGEWGALFIENYHKDWVKINEKWPKNNDFIMFNVFGELHCGVYLRKGKFYHISRAGSSLGDLDNDYWRSKVEGFYRHKELYGRNN